MVAYDVSEQALAAAKKRFATLAATYKNEVKGAVDGKADAALKRITLQMDVGRAVANADLVIEAVPENLELKRDIYRKIGKAAPAKTIFATNTSTLLPSDLMESTGRPERFLALHFANQIWIQNTAEVMGTPKTDLDVYRTIVAFASAIGMVPIELKKEHPKYVLNSLLTPFLDDAVQLLTDASPIRRRWTRRGELRPVRRWVRSKSLTWSACAPSTTSTRRAMRTSNVWRVISRKTTSTKAGSALNPARDSTPIRRSSSLREPIGCFRLNIFGSGMSGAIMNKALLDLTRRAILWAAADGLPVA